MNKSLKKIYEYHHRTSRKEEFAIMEKERSELLKNLIGSEKKILDLGCRDGVLTKYFLQGNDVLGADIDEISLNRAEKLGIKTILMDLNGDWEELEGQKFDVIVAAEILEHLYYPEKVIGRVVKHLNNNGIFIGSVPNSFSLKNRIKYFFAIKKNTPLDDPTHINQFNIRELKKILKKEFKEIKIIGLGRLGLLAKTAPSLFAFNLFFVAK